MDQGIEQQLSPGVGTVEAAELAAIMKKEHFDLHKHDQQQKNDDEGDDNVSSFSFPFWPRQKEYEKQKAEKQRKEQQQQKQQQQQQQAEEEIEVAPVECRDDDGHEKEEKQEKPPKGHHIYECRDGDEVEEQGQEALWIEAEEEEVRNNNNNNNNTESSSSGADDENSTTVATAPSTSSSRSPIPPIQQRQHLQHHVLLFDESAESATSVPVPFSSPDVHATIDRVLNMSVLDEKITLARMFLTQATAKLGPVAPEQALKHSQDLAKKAFATAADVRRLVEKQQDLANKTDEDVLEQLCKKGELAVMSYHRETLKNQKSKKFGGAAGLLLRRQKNKKGKESSKEDRQTCLSEETPSVVLEHEAMAWVVLEHLLPPATPPPKAAAAANIEIVPLLEGVENEQYNFNQLQQQQPPPSWLRGPQTVHIDDISTLGFNNTFEDEENDSLKHPSKNPCQKLTNKDQEKEEEEDAKSLSSLNKILDGPETPHPTSMLLPKTPQETSQHLTPEPSNSNMNDEEEEEEGHEVVFSPSQLQRNEGPKSSKWRGKLSNFNFPALTPKRRKEALENENETNKVDRNSHKKEKKSKQQLNNKATSSAAVTVPSPGAASACDNSIQPANVAESRSFGARIIPSSGEDDDQSVEPTTTVVPPPAVDETNENDDKMDNGTRPLLDMFSPIKIAFASMATVTSSMSSSEQTSPRHQRGNSSSILQPDRIQNISRTKSLRKQQKIDELKTALSSSPSKRVKKSKKQSELGKYSSMISASASGSTRSRKKRRSVKNRKRTEREAPTPTKIMMHHKLEFIDTDSIDSRDSSIFSGSDVGTFMASGNRSRCSSSSSSSSVQSHQSVISTEICSPEDIEKEHGKKRCANKKTSASIEMAATRVYAPSPVTQTQFDLEPLPDFSPGSSVLDDDTNKKSFFEDSDCGASYNDRYAMMKEEENDSVTGEYNDTDDVSSSISNEDGIVHYGIDGEDEVEDYENDEDRYHATAVDDDDDSLIQDLDSINNDSPDDDDDDLIWSVRNSFSPTTNGKDHYSVPREDDEDEEYNAPNKNISSLDRRRWFGSPASKRRSKKTPKSSKSVSSAASKGGIKGFQRSGNKSVSPMQKLFRKPSSLKSLPRKQPSVPARVASQQQQRPNSGSSCQFVAPSHIPCKSTAVRAPIPPITRTDSGVSAGSSSTVSSMSRNAIRKPKPILKTTSNYALPSPQKSKQNNNGDASTPQGKDNNKSTSSLTPRSLKSVTSFLRTPRSTKSVTSFLRKPWKQKGTSENPQSIENDRMHGKQITIQRKSNLKKRANSKCIIGISKAETADTAENSLVTMNYSASTVGEESSTTVQSFGSFDESTLDPSVLSIKERFAHSSSTSSSQGRAPDPRTALEVQSSYQRAIMHRGIDP